MNKKKRKAKREATKLYKKELITAGNQENSLYKFLIDPRIQKEIAKTTQQFTKAIQYFSKNFSKRRV